MAGLVRNGRRVVAVLADPNIPIFKSPPTVPGVEFVIGELDTLKAIDGVHNVDCLIAFCVGPKWAEQLTQLFPLLGGLKWIHSFTAGIDAMTPFIKDCLLAGPGAEVPLTNGRGAFSSSLAEWVMTSVLHFNKQIPRCQHNRRAKNYDRFQMDVVKGKTIGFVGYGHIATMSARIPKAFGMRVVAMRRDPAKPCPEGLVETMYGTDPASKKAMFAECDYVVSVLPSTPDTINFFDADTFASMKKDAVFVSIGRGTVVDEDALVDALKGHLKGAALDVFKVEPLPQDSRLWECDNLLFSAHNADLTADYHDLGWGVWQDNYEAFTAGRPLVTLADKHLGY